MIRIALSAVLFVSGAVLAAMPLADVARESQKTVNAAQRGFPLLNLQDGRKLGTTYRGAATALEGAQARATAMATADFNQDGAADLVAAYAGGNGGYLAFYRGNLETLSARTPETFEGMKRGQFPAPFAAEANLIAVPVAPDFVGTGDFNRDGAMDVIVAARGDSAVYLLAGNGRGEFKLERVAVNGQIAALLTGNIDPLDNLADVALSLSGGSGAELRVYSGSTNAFDGAPLPYPLPATATSLALGQLDDGAPMDILAAAGTQMVIVHGAYPSSGEADNSKRVEVIDQGFEIGAVRAGNFVWDRDQQSEIALLDPTGTVRILERDGLNKTPYTAAEGKQLWRVRREQLLAQDAAHGQEIAAGAQSSRRYVWSEADRMANVSAPVDRAVAATPAFFTSIRMTTEPVDDLVVVDSANRKIQILVKPNAELQQTGATLERSASGTRALISLDVAGTPAVVLPMRLSVMTGPGLVLLNQEGADISYLIAAPAATFTVTKTADTYDGACNADCSLREALQAANATQAADLVMIPAGTVHDHDWPGGRRFCK